MDETKKATPAALFGLFSDELNQRILEFRKLAVGKGWLQESETVDALPHLTISWIPDFDFRQADSLRGMLEQREFPATLIEVEKIGTSGGDIALFFDKEKVRLWVKEIGDVSESIGMDIVHTNQIKLLKTLIVSGNEEALIKGWEEIIPRKIEIKILGLGGKLLREEDLAWKLPLTGDYLKVRLKL